MKIFAVILNYGDINITNKCLESLSQVEKNIHIIVVNNNSDTLSKSYFKNLKNISVLNNFKNLGFSGGVNVGIKYALKNNAEYVLLLNNDTVLNKPITDVLQEKLLSSKNIGIVGPAISFKRNRKMVYDIGGNVNKFTGRTSHEEIENLSNTESKEVEYVSGCCMMIKKDVFEKVGLFDERFFLYYEDVDFCLRAKKVGLETWLVPSAVIFHELSQTIGKMSGLALYHQTRSGKLFGRKWLGIFVIFNLIFLSFQTAFFTIKNPSKGAWALKGLAF